VPAFLGKIDTLNKPDKTLAKKYDMSEINKARAIVSRFGLIDGVPVEEASNYIRGLEKYESGLSEKPTVQWAERKSADFDNLVTEDFNDLARYTSGAINTAKENLIISTQEGKQKVQDIVDSMVEQVGDVVRKPSDFKNLHDTITRPENRVLEMDDHKEGGLFSQHITRPVFDAIGDFNVKHSEVMKPIIKDLEKLPTGKTGKIIAHELETDGVPFTFGEETGNKAVYEVLAGFLNTGNESSYTKFLVGRGWGKVVDGVLDDSKWLAFTNRMFSEGIITKQHMDWVQSFFDAFEDLTPETQKAFRYCNGYNYKEVTPREINTPFGTYKGGYAVLKPAKKGVYRGDAAREIADLEASLTNEDLEFTEAFTQIQPNVSDSFAQERTEKGYKVTLDINVLLGRFSDIIKYTKMQPVVKDVLKILKNPTFKNKINKAFPNVTKNILVPFLTSAVSRKITVENPQYALANTICNNLRKGITIAFLGFKPNNILEQISAISTSILYVDAKFLFNSFLNTSISPLVMIRRAKGKSNYMKARMEDHTTRLTEIINKLTVDKSWFTKGLDKGANALALQHIFQNYLDAVVWNGKYNETLANAVNPKAKDYPELSRLTDEELEKEAIYRATTAVKLGAESHDPASAASAQKVSPFMSLLQPFYGYPLTVYNTVATKIKQALKNDKLFDKATGVLKAVLFGYIASAVIAKACLELFKAMLGKRKTESDEDDRSAFMEYLVDPSVDLFLGAYGVFGGFLRYTYKKFTKANDYGKGIMSQPVFAIAEGTAKAGVALMELATNEDKERLTNKEKKDLLLAIFLVTNPVAYAGLYNTPVHLLFEKDESED
jgi:hypothetical protein